VSCKICAEATVTEADRLVEVCASGYCHVECLKRWFKENCIIVEKEHLKSYHFPAFSCATCLKSVPFTVKTEEGSPINLTETPDPTTPHTLTLESLNSTRTIKMVYVLTG